MNASTTNAQALRTRITFLLKDSLLYGGASAVGKAFSLITFPVMARHLSVADFGVTDFYLVLVGLLATLFVFGQDSAVGRYFYKYKRIAERRQLVSQSLLLQLSGLFVVLPCLWWSSGLLNEHLIQTNESERLLKIALLQAPFLVLINFSQNLLKWTFERIRFIIMSVGYAATYASLVVVTMSSLQVGVEEILWIGVCVNSIFGLIGLYLVRKWISVRPGRARIKELLTFGTPLAVICVLSAFGPAVERALTSRFLGAEQLGIYASGVKVTMVIGLVVTAFQTAWSPFALALHKKPDAIETYNRVLKLFSAGICLLVLLASVMAQPIIRLLLSDRYAEATSIVLPLGLSLAIQGASWITELGVAISGRSYLNLYSYCILMIATTCGIIILAPHLGITGVAVGVLLGSIARAVVSSWLGQKAYPMCWEYRPATAIFGVTLTFGMGSIWANRVWGETAYSWTLAGGITGVLAVSWWVVLSQEERQAIQNKIQQCVA